MLKLFESYVQDNLENKFLEKIKLFLEKITIDDHQVVNYESYKDRTVDESDIKYVSIYYNDSQNDLGYSFMGSRDLFTVSLNRDELINVYYDDYEGLKKYPSLFKYIDNELSSYLSRSDDVPLSYKDESFFTKDKLTLEIINKLDFSVEEYEIFKESGRFGL